MATTLRMPQFGMGITEGKIAKWLKAEGEAVSEGEPIVEIETAKAVQEVESPTSGILGRVLVPEQSIVPVREPIALIAEAGETLPDPE